LALILSVAIETICESGYYLADRIFRNETISGLWRDTYLFTHRPFFKVDYFFTNLVSNPVTKPHIILFIKCNAIVGGFVGPNSFVPLDSATN
jgi:hypothetical protein